MMERISAAKAALAISPKGEQKLKKALESYPLFKQLTNGMDDRGKQDALRRFYLPILLNSGTKDKEVLIQNETGKDARTLENFRERTLNYMEDLYRFGKAVGVDREAEVALIALSSFVDIYQRRVKDLPEEVTIHAAMRDDWLSATLFLLVQFTEARTGAEHYGTLAKMLTAVATAIGKPKPYTGDFIRKRVKRYSPAVSRLQVWWETLYPSSNGAA